jgi:hypothetical protein
MHSLLSQSRLNDLRISGWQRVRSFRLYGPLSPTSCPGKRSSARTAPDRSFQAKPTAQLIREVERYGAAEGDVESEADFTARLVAQAILSAERPAVLAERRRYELAQAPEDVVSVFRAVMPMVEGIVRRLLRAQGSKKEHGSLGPMIAELAERRIGTLGLWSQLSAVLTNGRDISLHGEELPIAVLRITTETCFELIPQLGLLFPTLSLSTDR